MSICNVYRYQNAKTIKLSDAYRVTIKLTNNDLEKIGPFLSSYQWLDLENKILELPECLSVTLPEISLKEEVYSYGNNKRMFLIPDYEKPDDLKIELMEHYDATNIFGGEQPNELSSPIGLVQLLVNLFTSKLFNAEKFCYILNDYIPELTITVLSNNLRHTVYQYIFKELKLTDYTKYNLDYSSNDVCKWSLSFSYRTYEAGENISMVNSEMYIDPEDESIGESPTEQIDPQLPETSDNPDGQTGTTNGVDSPSDSEGGSSVQTTPGEPDAPTPEDNVAPAGEPSTPAEPTDKEPTSAGVNPATPSAHSADQIDELAYQMMNGDLGNGQARKDAASAASFSDEEIQQAQNIVNEGKWDELRDRHNARSENSSVPQSDYDGVNPDTMKIETELKGDLQPPEITPGTPVNGEANRQAEAQHRDEINSELHQDLIASDLASISDEPGSLPTPEENLEAGIIPAGAHSADQIDELAYQMMRGELGNGQARKDAASAAGFSDDEIQQAQDIVNERKWNELRDRHNARPQLNDITDGNYSDAPSSPSDLLNGEDMSIDLQMQGDLKPPEMPEAQHVDAVANREAEAARRDEINSSLKLDPLDDFYAADELGGQSAPKSVEEPPASEIPQPASQPPASPYQDLQSEEGRKTAKEFAASKEGYEEALSKVQKVRDNEFMDGWFVVGRYDDNQTNSFEYTKRNQVIEQRRTDLAKLGMDYNNDARLQAEDEWAQGKLGDYYK